MSKTVPIIAVLFFSLTLCLSASLLFFIEPMFGRMVLPFLGGTPAVWNTCMMFYQVVLLLGYLYSHLTIQWLGSRRQSLVHLVVLLVPWLTGTFVIGVSERWIPNTMGNPVWGTLLLLSASIGIPMFVISVTAPMVQRWFSATHYPGAKDPYFLYAASNLGSFVGLLAYPFWIEPRFSLQGQTQLATCGLAALTLMTIGCVLLMRWKFQAASTQQLDFLNLEQTFAAEQLHNLGVKQNRWSERLLWILLSAIPSSLLLGTTTYLATDIASFPLLWVIPLSLYLLTFVVAFARHMQWFGYLCLFAQPVILAVLAANYFQPLNEDNLLVMLGLHLLAFFVATMICHGRLAHLRPEPTRLTEYYLLMSLGGLLGGVFNTLIAPEIFSSVFEYPLMIVAATLLRPVIQSGGTPPPQSVSQSPPAPAIVPTDGTTGVAALRHSWASLSSSQGVRLWFDFLIPSALFFLFLFLYWPGECSLQNYLNRHTPFRQSFEWDFGRGPLSAMTVLTMLFGVTLIFLSRRPLRYGLSFGALLLGLMIGHTMNDMQAERVGDRETTTRTIFTDRSFFGVLRVRETRTYNVNDRNQTVRVEHQLLNGSTTHGIQEFYLQNGEAFPGTYNPPREGNPFLRWDDWTCRNRPSSYYAISGPLGQIFTDYLSPGADQIGIIGLGTGTTAALRYNQQHFTYFEIDPAVERIARNPELFTYLSDNFPNSDGLEIRIGDARLELQKIPDGQFDLLVTDAFSSDAIPVHLLTREAIALQLSKIRHDGLLMVHLSNRHLQLAPVVGNIAKSLKVPALRYCYSPSDEEDEWGAYASEYVVLANDPLRLEPLRYSGSDWEEIDEAPEIGVWTDDYSNILSVMTVFNPAEPVDSAESMEPVESMESISPFDSPESTEAFESTDGSENTDLPTNSDQTAAPSPPKPAVSENIAE